MIGTVLTAEAKYPINFTQSGKRFVLSLHCNGRNSFLFVNATKLYQFKPKERSEVKPNTLCLDNISNDFIVDNMKSKIVLKVSVKVFLLILILLILTIF